MSQINKNTDKAVRLKTKPARIRHCHTCSFHPVMTEFTWTTISMWCLPTQAHSIHVGSLNPGKQQGEVAGREESHLWCIFLSWLWEMWGRVIQSYWNSRAIRHVYQIDPSLMWQKQHVLLFNEPTGVNTSQAAHELQWSSVYFACNTRRFFWHFCSQVQRKKI